jgi:hypothetical protein
MGDFPAWGMGGTNNPHCKKIAYYAVLHKALDLDKLFNRKNGMGETCSTHRSYMNWVQNFDRKIREEELA